MRLLTFTTLYPNAARPNHGIFVETRLRKLVDSGKVESRVLAPVPWFPARHSIFGQYAQIAKAPSREARFGIEVMHPRYPSIPKIGMAISPYLLAYAMKPVIRRIISDGYDFDLIDAHYFYPDGVAAVMLGEYFKKPVVVTGRGSDITVIPGYHTPRKMILGAANKAAAVITVCNALKSELVNLGVAPERVTCLRNGVDLELFRLGDREVARKRYGLDQFTLLSVGNLVPIKGHDLIIAALPMLKDVRLLFAGSGPERGRLEALARRLNVASRVTFLGTVPQAELSVLYGAADALVLASKSEGWANVLLESMACGTPVVASNVWGMPEVVDSSDAGVLMHERTPAGVAQAVLRLRENYPDRVRTRRYAEQFSWEETTNGQLCIFEALLGVNKTYPHSRSPDYAAQVKVANNKYPEHETSAR